ncbi:MAG: carbamoyltransferase HypF, partial [Pseudomonadota bacterium]
MRLTVTGKVQGVGFRPFVYRLASEEGVAGAVQNTPQGVSIDAEGCSAALTAFEARLRTEAPPLAMIDRMERTALSPTGAVAFEIRESPDDGDISASLTPDAAVCADCLEEISDQRARRFRYPFTNCSHCGPRYSILRSLPYDRANTTMSHFKMCAACREEYEEPCDRRFHTQPIACPDCGPQVFLVDRHGALIAERDEALRMSAEQIRNGAIVAIKGLGGFHLMCDARNNESIMAIRRRKQRPAKPFAVMFRSIETIEKFCKPTPLEREIVSSSQAPIVLMKKRDNVNISDALAPDNPWLGALLPYTPLHQLLLDDVDFPIVVTSGNRRSEPIAIDNDVALSRLSEIADIFLMHDRPIARPVEDSVVRTAANAPLMLRRARGFAPGVFQLQEGAPSIFAVGGHLKNTIAKSIGGRAFVSPHIGDLDTIEARQAFDMTAHDFLTLHNTHPTAFACDNNSDYASSQYA